MEVKNKLIERIGDFDPTKIQLVATRAQHWTGEKKFGAPEELWELIEEFIAPTPTFPQATQASATPPANDAHPLLVPQTAGTGAAPDVASWTVEDVGNHLKRLNLGLLRRKFEDNGIDGAALTGMFGDAATLASEMEIERVQATRIMSSLRR